jgi:rSAM/selenodomain-associated transferase 1
MSSAGGIQFLAIMAKAPRAAYSKTRLIPAIGAEGAARLAAAMIRDTAELCLSVSRSRVGLSAAICFAPDDGEEQLRDLAPGVATFVAQRGDSLGQRLSAVFDDLFQGGAERVVVVGADSPTLPAEVIERAFDRLEQGMDLVIGPTRDGGYYLIGLRRPTSALFVAIPWSTSRVLAATLDRAAAKGLTVELLPEWYDIDEPTDLEHLEALFATGYTGAPFTRVAIQTWRER